METGFLQFQGIGQLEKWTNMAKLKQGTAPPFDAKK